MFNGIRSSEIKKHGVFRGTLSSVGILVICALFMAGCGGSSGSGGSSTIFTVGGENCSRQETRAIILQYQKECASTYGLNLWTDSAVDRTELVDYIKNSAVSQLAWVYTLDAAAEGMGIVLSDYEVDQTKAAAAYYLDSMDEAESEFVDISESDAQELFERYLLAEKAYTAIIDGVSTEVSDNDALVMDIQEICVPDVDTAYEILGKLQDGDDFTGLAETYSTNDEISITVTRDTFNDTVSDIIFSMDTGDYSDVIGIGNDYYIFYCENYYDEALTAQNRANVLEQRREDAVREVCDSYADPADSVLREDNLEKIEVDTSISLTGPSFREVFQYYFG